MDDDMCSDSNPDTDSNLETDSESDAPPLAQATGSKKRRAPRKPSGPFREDPDASVLENLCRRLRLVHGLSSKGFIKNFLLSKEPSIVVRRGRWISHRDWDSTEEIMDIIHQLAMDDGSLRAKEDWNAFILKHAILIVNSQNTPTRPTKTQPSHYVNAKTLSKNDLSQRNTQKHADMVENRMSFMHKLISAKLADSHKKQLSVPVDQNADAEYDQFLKAAAEETPEDDLMDIDDPVDEQVEKEVGGGAVRLGEDKEEAQEEAEDLSTPEDGVEDMDEPGPDSKFWHSKNKQDCLRARIATLTTTIMSIYAFACNRRCNAFQVENALAFVSCGVTERVNKYLNYVGLSSSRMTAMRGLESLGNKAAKKIKIIFSKDSKVAPSIVLDNIDIQERIHHARLDKLTQMYHGTWGYVHPIPQALLKEMNDSEFFKKSRLADVLNQDPKARVDPKSFYLNQDEHDRWVLSQKGQLANVLAKYVLDPSVAARSEYLNLKPIDQISCEPPDITMFKMMDSTDNGSDGIGQLYHEVLHQTGLTPEEFSRRIQIMEGDLGTCLNIFGLQMQRNPTKHDHKSLQHILMVPGAGHTLWNIAHALLLMHWGDPTNKKDMGAWQTVVALGGKKDIPSAKKDFTTMLRWIEKILNSTLTYALLQTLGKDQDVLEEKLDLSLEEFNRIVDTTFDNFCSATALKTAKSDDDEQKVQLLLRIRDFSTVVEANQAMHAGDIGRLMLVWKKWGVMLQGMKGLTHYSNYLPRLVLLLTKTLPRPVAKIILHGMLISPSGRPNHFVAKDFFLEVQNYWIKFFYNNTGTGTEISRLKDVFSLNVPVLRQMVTRMNSKSGKNSVQQSSKTILPINTLQKFISFAQDHELAQSRPGSRVQKGLCQDILCLGMSKLAEDSLNGRLGRFYWPVGRTSNPNATETEDLTEEEEEEELMGRYELDEEILDLVDGEGFM